MFKSKYCLFLCLLLGVLSSCDKEGDPTPQTELDYLPTSKGSTWNYEGSYAYTLTSTGGTKNINGKTFHEFEQKQGSNITKSFLNKENGIYTSSSDTQIGNITLINLKENEPEGASWQNQITASNGIISTYTFTIIKKGLTKTVRGKDYKNVIHVRSVYSASFMGTTFPSTIPPYNYYHAKGVGMISTETSNSIISELATYSIK